MTAPAANVSTTGKGGVIAAKSLATGGAIVYLPGVSWVPRINTGRNVEQLINNAFFAANETEGIATCSFQMGLPFISGIITSDFITRAVLSAQTDTDAGNYHTISAYPDGNGSAPKTYAKCKYGSFSGRVRFSPDGRTSSMGLSLTGNALDPESTVTALTAPSAGAISTGKIRGFASCAFTGVNGVAEFGFNIVTGLAYSDGTAAGTNAKYPVVAYGLLQNTIAGTVTVTQKKNSSLVLDDDGTIAIAIGATGSGVSLSFQLIPLGDGKPVTVTQLYETRMYELKSIDGTTVPVTATDL